MFPYRNNLQHYYYCFYFNHNSVSKAEEAGDSFCGQLWHKVRLEVSELVLLHFTGAQTSARFLTERGNLFLL